FRSCRRACGRTQKASFAFAGFEKARALPFAFGSVARFASSPRYFKTRRKSDTFTAVQSIPNIARQDRPACGPKGRAARDNRTENDTRPRTCPAGGGLLAKDRTSAATRRTCTGAAFWRHRDRRQTGACLCGRTGALLSPER